MRETEILAEEQPPQGVFVCDHAGLVNNQFSLVPRKVWWGGLQGCGLGVGEGLSIACLRGYWYRREGVGHVSGEGRRERWGTPTMSLRIRVQHQEQVLWLRGSSVRSVERLLSS